MAETAPPDTIFSGEKRGLTIAVMASIGIIAYSNLGLTAALPDIGNDLGDVALLPWTITVELLMSGVAVLAALVNASLEEGDGYYALSVLRDVRRRSLAPRLLCARLPTPNCCARGR